MVQRLLTDSSRRPDETWLLCESQDDAAVLERALKGKRQRGVFLKVIPTPRAHGSYKVIPYSNKINWALNRTSADLIVYLDNGSTPHPRKYEVMAGALEQHPRWGAVYCTQKRTGYHNVTHEARDVLQNGDGQVNYTQVMHRITDDRWPLDMALADPDVADGKFWSALHRKLGPFHPVGGGRVLDEHHMPDAKAVGV